MYIKGNPGESSQLHFSSEGLYQQAVSLWENSWGGGLSAGIQKVSPREKRENEKALLQLIEKMEKAASQEKLEKVLKKFFLEGPVFSREAKEIFKDPDFFKSSKAFIKKVQDYEPEIPKEDVGQAFRNVWIMNMLQKAFMLPVSCSDGVFGYSMLYPYTDNFMDDPEVEMKEKYSASQRLKQRLSGEKIKSRGKNERKIYDMIAKIEQTYPRESCSEVFQSLLYIHQCQVDSLKQQSGKSTKNPQKDWETASRQQEILRISVHKGGASVLADGYLVKGVLDPDEQKFCFNYGVLLQMADDLQDCKGDYQNGHQTLFSVDYGGTDFDRRAHQLIRFSARTFWDFFNGKKAGGMEVFLRENTLLLILGSVLINPSCFSPRYLHWAEERFPVSRRFLETQQRLLGEKFKQSTMKRTDNSYEPVVK